MTTYFIWIESFTSPPGRAARRVSFAVEQLPDGPVQRLEKMRIADDATARRCELLRQLNGIQISVKGEHTLEFIVDRALAKVAYRHVARRKID
jgi:hypothetical protein